MFGLPPLSLGIRFLSAQSLHFFGPCMEIFSICLCRTHGCSTPVVPSACAVALALLKLRGQSFKAPSMRIQTRGVDLFTWILTRSPCGILVRKLLGSWVKDSVVALNCKAAMSSLNPLDWRIAPALCVQLLADNHRWCNQTVGKECPLPHLFKDILELNDAKAGRVRGMGCYLDQKHRFLRMPLAATQPCLWHSDADGGPCDCESAVYPAPTCPGPGRG